MKDDASSPAVPAPLQRVGAAMWRGGALTPSHRALPEETPVAMSYDRASFAVMMATPTDLEDFAVGFSLSEGIIATPDEITRLELVALDQGVECRMALRAQARAALDERRRQFAGPVGCGLCGLEHLRQALRPLPPVTAPLRLAAGEVAAMLAHMAPGQVLNRQTRAVHAAAFFQPGQAAPVLLREDVGRHNALDKLVGGLARLGVRADTGAVLLTSRVSIELIEKTARLGAPVLIAISVPTALAVRAADQAGITLIAVARDDGFEIFTHPERITQDESARPRGI